MLPRYSASNTVILDTARAAAGPRPYNGLPVRQYTEELVNSDRQCAAVVASSVSAWTSDSAGDDSRVVLPDDIEERVVEDAASQGVQPDETLLAVIGVLSGAGRQVDVAGWMRRGGLYGSKRPVAGDEDEPKVAEAAPSSPSQPIPEASASPLIVATPTIDRAVPPVLASRETARPTDVDGGPPASPGVWYEDVDVYSEWISKGKAELSRLRIPVRHGIDPPPMLLPTTEATGDR